MKKRSKILLLLAAVVAAVALFASQFSLHSELEKRIAAQLTLQGLSKVEVSIAQLDKQHILFSRLSFAKDKIRVAAEDINIVATALPIAELLRSNYANVAADWSVKTLTVSGIPYELPPLSGAGKAREGEVSGELHDAKRAHESRFTIMPKEVLLHAIHLPWQGAKVSAQKVRIALGERQPIHIPLRIENLPLTTLLAMISSDKASGTGTVSGKVELIIFPDGRFDVRDGKFAAKKSGLIQLSPDALPGEGAQMDIARTALSNFHYKDLSLMLSPDKQGKPLIRLNLEGNNPNAFNGRTVKLNVNLSGDVLELLQQTVMPMADPTRFIEKEKK